MNFAGMNFVKAYWRELAVAVFGAAVAILVFLAGAL